MPARICINPVIRTVGLDGTLRRSPKVMTMADPGRPPVTFIDDDGVEVTTVPKYVHSSAISDGLPGQVNDWCLSLVAGKDMTPLDSDPEIVSLFEADDNVLSELRTWLTSTPKGLGWSGAKQIRMRTRLEAKGADVSGLTGDTPLWKIVNRIGQILSPSFDIRRSGTSLRGEL